MSANRAVTGTFNAAPPPTRTLTVTKAGGGSGTITGPGINCPGDCTETYADGTAVSLTATAAVGDSFAGYSGDCTGSTCNLTMSANRALIAAFTAGSGADATPPDTTIDKGPKAKTRSRKARFYFHSSEAGSTFRCSVLGRKVSSRLKQFNPCSSPTGYKNVPRGKHTFQVVATDAAGNVDPTPATYKWKVVR